MNTKRQIDPYRPWNPPTNPDFGMLCMTLPGMYGLKYNSRFAAQTSWSYARMTDVGQCLHCLRVLISEETGKQTLAFVDMIHILLERFGCLMGGVNIDAHGGGLANYILIDPVDEGRYDCHFNRPFDNDMILSLVNADPYLTLVPYGWAKTVIEFTKKGVERVDDRPPPGFDPGRGRALFAHGKPGPNQAHCYVTRDNGHWNWRFEPIPGYGMPA